MNDSLQEADTGEENTTRCQRQREIGVMLPTSWGIPKATRSWKTQESPHLEALEGAWPYEHLEFRFLTSKTVIKQILFLNNLPMSIIIRPSADNDIAEAILLMMWLRYLTGQWERDFWDGKGSTNYIWQILISGFSELTQHHNLTSKVSCEILVLK